jgi:hypothetical protein
VALADNARYSHYRREVLSFLYEKMNTKKKPTTNSQGNLVKFGKRKKGQAA